MKRSKTGKSSENVGGLEGEFFIPSKMPKPHPAGLENTAIPQFKIKITEIPQEKLSNTAIPQTPMSPSNSSTSTFFKKKIYSFLLFCFVLFCFVFFLFRCYFVCLFLCNLFCQLFSLLTNGNVSDLAFPLIRIKKLTSKF